MCSSVAAPIPTLLLPPEALDAWLLVCLELIAMTFSFRRFSSHATGFPRNLIGAALVLGMFFVMAATIIGLAVYIPWTAALSAWYETQTDQLLSKGCPLIQLHHNYDAAQMAAAQLEHLPNILLATGAFLIILTTGYSISQMWRIRRTAAQ